MLLAFVLAYVGLLVAGVVVSGELGERLAAARLARLPPDAQLHAGGLETSVLGLLGLLIAFTFSGAADRFDQRRTLIIQEANDIGTAWLRLDLLPDHAREESRAAMRDYVDARLAYYHALANDESLPAATDVIDARAATLWSIAERGAMEAHSPAVATVVLPALNTMFDTGNERRLHLLLHPPPVVYAMLFAIALVASFVGAYCSAHRGQGPNRLLQLLFAIVLGVSAFVILDMEYPRQGFVRIDDFDAALVELRSDLDADQPPQR